MQTAAPGSQRGRHRPRLYAHPCDDSDDDGNGDGDDSGDGGGNIKGSDIAVVSQRYHGGITAMLQ
jgi:hypothetical protein